MGLIKTFLAFTFRASTNQLSLYSFLAGLGGCNLRLCLIDTGHRFSDARVLQLPLPMSSRNCGVGLIDLCLIVIVLQFDEEIALVHQLVVSHIHRAHDA